jgi:hypothetical protein
MPSLRKSLFFAFLLLALISQSVTAVTMKCELQQQGDSHTMVGMTHTMSDMSHEMVMSTQAKDLNHVSDCCNTMEHCVSGSCSLPAFSHFLSLTPILATTTAVDIYSSKFPVKPVSSLYRPPIFR